MNSFLKKNQPRNPGTDFLKHNFKTNNEFDFNPVYVIILNMLSAACFLICDAACV
jgi:hypothetical protein